MIDISDRDNLLKYLLERSVVSDVQNVFVRYFSGGVSGATALVRDSSGREFIVKQAFKKLNVAADWECDPARMKIEYDCLAVYNKFVPECVPAAISYDSNNFIMIRHAVPEDWVMWKSQLLDGIFNYSIAEKTAIALSTIHNETSRRDDIAKRFEDSGVFYNLRVEPYILFLKGKYPELKDKADALAALLLESRIALIHGDYSPKNILVKDNDICILDMEVAYFGHPCFDLAFLANHFLLKAVARKDIGEAYLCMMQHIVQVYFSNVSFMDIKRLEGDTVKTLGFLFLARVDGKSPVEYLTDEDDKNIVRFVSHEIINRNFSSFSQVAACVKEKIKN